MTALARLAVAHPRHVVLAALVAGLLLGPRTPGAEAWPATLILLGAGRLRPRLPVGVVLASAAAVGLGALAADARLEAMDRSSLGASLGHAADVRGIVLRPPRARSHGRTAALVKLPSGERALVVAAGPVRAAVGEEVRVRGGWEALPAYESAMRRAGAHALLRAESVVATGRRRGGLAGAVDEIRGRAERALSAGVPGQLGGLARGMVLGADEALSEETRAAFRASGLAHLVAASGANVALLAAFVLALGAATGAPWRLRLVLALGIVALYVPLAGGGPSIQRAGVMGAATLVATLASRTASRWYALLLAAGVTLALDPRAAEDPGWQLSFAAVLAILGLSPPLRDALARRLPRPVAEAMAVAVAAAVATAPLIALHFGRVSWVTIPANLLALPAVAPVMWLGTVAAAVGQVSPALAAPLMAVAGWPLAFVAAVAHGAAALPGAEAEVDPGSPLPALWLFGLAAAAVPGVRRRVARGRRRPWVRGTVAVAVGTTLVWTALGHGPEPPHRLTVSALDVGQGDATLVQQSGHAVLVDTGPPGGDVVGRLRKAGVEALDLLVVTHAQADHDGAAAAVLRAFPVDLVLDGRDGRRTPGGEAMAAAARAAGARMVPAAAGQRIRVGPMVLDVLHPRPEPASAHAGEDPNLRPVVAELRTGGFSMLLAADAESGVLGTLPLRDVDVLKVPHHGSADPGLPAVLRRLRPEVALIEVGRANRYGHPAESTLEALRVVPRVHRTDREGTVVLTP